MHATNRSPQPCRCDTSCEAITSHALPNKHYRFGGHARSIQAPLQRTQLRRSRIPPSLLSLCAPSPSSRRAACAPAAPQQVCARICCARALAVIPLYSLYTTFPLFISNFDFDIATSASIVAARSCIFDYPASSHSSRCAARALSSPTCVCAHICCARALVNPILYPLCNLPRTSPARTTPNPHTHACPAPSNPAPSDNSQARPAARHARALMSEGVKPYCSICDRAFARMKMLQEHHVRSILLQRCCRCMKPSAQCMQGCPDVGPKHPQRMFQSSGRRYARTLRCTQHSTELGVSPPLSTQRSTPPPTPPPHVSCRILQQLLPTFVICDV